jgi:hypothetical protein
LAGRCIRPTAKADRATFPKSQRGIFLKILATGPTHALLRRHLRTIKLDNIREEKPMMKTPRWMQSTIAEANSCTTKLPWERGLRREAFMAGRRAVAALADSQMRTVRPAA